MQDGVKYFRKLELCTD